MVLAWGANTRCCLHERERVKRKQVACSCGFQSPWRDVLPPIHARTQEHERIEHERMATTYF